MGALGKKATVCRVEGCGEPRWEGTSMARCHYHYNEYYRLKMLERYKTGKAKRKLSTRENVPSRKRERELKRAYERLGLKQRDGVGQ